MTHDGRPRICLCRNGSRGVAGGGGVVGIIRVALQKYWNFGEPGSEDLLQAAYAKVMSHWWRVCRYDNPDAYLRRVMISIRTSWWRQLRGREVLTAQPPDHAGTARGSRGPGTDGDPAVAEAELDRLLWALRTLPRRQQIAVVLRHYCDLSEAETAATLGISVGGVKSLTSRGLTALRAVLASTSSTSSPLEEIR
jgi:RNA polymerase sigma factor (sigma-70 family)